MSSRLVLALVALAAVGGGAAFYFLQNGAGGGLDAAGRALLERVEVERQREDVDAEACRELLVEIRKHPAHETNRDLLRGRAWLEYLLGRVGRAWELIESNLGVDATVADALLGSRVLERRYAASGDDGFGHRAAVLARRHFEETRDLASLFLAWQIQVRRGRTELQKALADILQAEFADSNEAKLVQLLAQYPMREDATALPELQRLQDAFATIPAELDLALALFEVEKPPTIDAAMERVERVLREQQSNATAKTVGAVCAMRQGDFARARGWLDSLLRQRPDDPRAKVWRGLLEAVQNAEKR